MFVLELESGKWLKAKIERAGVTGIYDFTGSYFPKINQ